ncbi:MAG: helicase-related protein [Actinomycetota bacterium]
MQPLRFLLADDPGAGKTIVSGLYLRELVLRGDLHRCLIVAPGSLVEQWQEELWDKFSLSFDILSRDMVEASRTGNPFLDRHFLVARIDQLSRNEDLLAKLGVAEWDLVVVDEAHKMSAHLYGNEVDKTKRFLLGEQLREQTRNLLLLTATPHNGKNEDFLLFMSLLDPERFEGRLRNDADMPDVSDVMRRYVKENLLTFEGKRLFPERIATTLNYDLSPQEMRLYEEVTNYVRTGMNRAQAMQEGGDRRRGLIVGFALAGLQRRLASSPAAIHDSLRRRREKLESQVAEMDRLAKGGQPIPITELPKGILYDDLEDFDFDDYDDDELEALEDAVIDSATAAATAAELEKELVELRELERIAREVRASRQDRKWNELATILQSEQFTGGDNPRKLLVFTEHKDTLHYLTERIGSLLGRPDAVVTIHGGIKREERRRVQDAFRNDPAVQVLVATDAAGEGVNLQRANLMVNYDIPWNPNRIEQRFGRIHRIGQKQPCFLWNLVAHETHEGKVFERLFQKIEQQRGVYGDQIYDVLGDPIVNRALQDLLIDAIRYGEDPTVVARMEEVVNADIGRQFEEVLAERALASEVLAGQGLAAIRDQMELAKARKLQPGFVEAFFNAALAHVGGRIARRERGRFEITRVPATVRSRDREARVQGPRAVFGQQVLRPVRSRPGSRHPTA